MKYHTSIWVSYFVIEPKSIYRKHDNPKQNITKRVLVVARDDNKCYAKCQIKPESIKKLWSVATVLTIPAEINFSSNQIARDT